MRWEVIGPVIMIAAIVLLIVVVAFKSGWLIDKDDK